MKDGEDIPEETEDTITLLNVNATIHGGTYTCVVRNEAGTESATSVLNVVPLTIAQPSDIATDNGTSASFVFVVEAYPPASYTWEFLDGEFGSTTTGSFTNTLSFSPVVFGNEGRYRCSASSDREVVQSNLVTLTGISTCNPVVLSGLFVFSLQYYTHLVLQFPLKEVL